MTSRFFPIDWLRRAPRSLASSTASRNAASSFVALGWLSLLSMLTIPLYIRVLGVAEWGLVAACTSLQVISNFIDAGFSQIVPRWAAQEASHLQRLRRYVELFRRVYVLLGLVMFLILQSAAGYLAHHWFQVPAGRADELEWAIRIVSFQFLFQFLNNLHIGLWLGLQRQVLANVRACGFGTLKHAAALSALVFWKPSAWVYAAAFAVVALLEVVINRQTVSHMLGPKDISEPAERITLRPLLKEVSVLSGGILIGLLVSQLDRIVLSRTLDVGTFGIYTVVAALALAFLQLQAPVTRAYFPLLVRDIQMTGRVSPLHVKRLLGGTLIFATAPALLTCALAPQVLSLWLHNPHIVSVGTTPLRLLLVAIALNSVYGCIYQVIIAAGQSHRVLQFNLISLVVACLTLIVLGTSGGIILGAVIWISNSATQLTLGSLWLIGKRRHA